MIHEMLTQKVIGAGMTVLNALKPGLDEKIYENALVLELKAAGLATEQQRQFPVHYRNTLVGTLVPDLIVDHRIVVDTKVVAGFTESHVAQMIGYLAITGLEVGLLLNFKSPRLQWKRIIRTKDMADADLPDADSGNASTSPPPKQERKQHETADNPENAANGKTKEPE